MELRFLLGIAGTGKSHRILEGIASACAAAPEGPPLLLLMPEQATFVAERELVARCGGYTRARVLSFTRLLELVFSDSPAPSLPRLKPAHRILLAARIVQQRRATGEGGLFAIRGIEESLARFATEAGQQVLSPDSLANVPDDPRAPMLREKAAQLATFLGEFRRIQRARFEDPAETMVSAHEAVLRCASLQGAELHVDGFHGFTPAEEVMLAFLLQRCVRVTVALSTDGARARAILDARPLPPHPLFAYPEDTLRRLLRVAEHASAPVIAEYLTDGTEHQASALCHLAASFLRRKAAPDSEAESAVELIEASGRREEVRLAAVRCRDWIREGMDPGSIVVITRVLDAYAPLIAELFSTARIPFFMDRAEPMNTHPLLQALQAALRVVEHGWQWQDVCESARCGLAALTPEDSFRLERRCRHHPPLPSEWLSAEPWPLPPSRSFFEDEEATTENQDADAALLDRLRRAAAEPLARFEASIRAGKDDPPFGEWIRALADLAESWRQQQRSDESPETAALFRQLGELLGDALDALGEECLDQAEAVEHLQSLLSCMTLPRIPPLLGQVTIGQADRSRFPPCTAAIVLGLGADQWPLRTRNSTILNDAEREVLTSLGVNAAPSTHESFRREPFHAWQALTRSVGILVVTRPLLREGGAAQPPSPYWAELRRLLPQVPVRRISSSMEAEHALRIRELAAWVLREHGHSAERAPMKTDRIRAAFFPQDGAVEVSTVFASAGDRNAAALSPALIQENYKGIWRSSVSALESFARCPFQHFMRVMLRPEEPLLPEADQRDTGNVAHAILLEAGLQLREERRGFGDIHDDELASFFDEAAAGPLRRAERSGVFRNESGRLLLQATVQLVRDAFHYLVLLHRTYPSRVDITEDSFGGDGTIGPLDLNVDTDAARWTAQLRGQIDRVDIVQLPDGREGFVVFDYKMSRHRFFTLRAWDAGTALQLPVYLSVIGDGGRHGVPLGAFNVGIAMSTDERRVLADGNPETIRLKGLAATELYSLAGDGAWNTKPYLQGAQCDPWERIPNWGSAITRDDLAQVIINTKERITDIVRDIVLGAVSIAPLESAEGLACAHCGFKAVCGVDPSLNSPRVPERFRHRDVLAMLRGEESP